MSFNTTKLRMILLLDIRSAFLALGSAFGERRFWHWGRRLASGVFDTGVTRTQPGGFRGCLLPVMVGVNLQRLSLLGCILQGHPKAGSATEVSEVIVHLMGWLLPADVLKIIHRPSEEFLDLQP